MAAGVKLENAIRALENISPITSRMSPYTSPDGVVFIHDDNKAPLWTVKACVDFLQKAQAERKFLVVGSISDTPKGYFHRYRSVIEEAGEVVDMIFFVGDHAQTALKIRTGGKDNNVMAFNNLYSLNTYLADHLKSGDLILLKGSNKNDHLQRLALSQTDDIECWREKCKKTRSCSRCKHRLNPHIPTDKVEVG